MSFDSLHFEALIWRGVRNGTKGKREAYGLSSLSKLDDLLGERWYMRGLNSAGDFCYIEPGTVKFYLKCRHQKIDFQLQDDGSMKTQYFGNRHHLVFQELMAPKHSGIVSSAHATVEVNNLYRV